MAKDPAFLFYSSDFLTGTMAMSDAEVGQYIRLLCYQHQSGHINAVAMQRLCGGTPSASVLDKFIKDDDGLFFNERLEGEVIKRKKHSEQQKENANMRWHKSGIAAAMPLEDVNENEIKVEKGKRGTGEKTRTTAQIAFDLIPDTFHGDEFAVLWDDYEKLRKKKNRPLTETAVKQRVGQLVAISGGKWGIAKASMEETISSGWDRFFEVKSNQGSNPIKNERREIVRDKA